MNTRFSDNVNYRKQVGPVVLNLDSFSFLVLADTHYYKENKCYFKQIEQLRLQCGFEFVVVAGDVTQSGREEQFEFVFQDLKSLLVPCYFVLGNHDIQNKGNKLFGKYFGEYVYSFDVGRNKFIFLDSANGVFGDRQKDWYEKVLCESSLNTFVFSHYHVNTTGVFQNPVDYPYPEERYYLLHTNELYGVDYFISGHLHESNSATIRGVEYITLNTAQDGNFAMLFSVSGDEITRKVVVF